MNASLNPLGTHSVADIEEHAHRLNDEELFQVAKKVIDDGGGKAQDHYVIQLIARTDEKEIPTLVERFVKEKIMTKEQADEIIGLGLEYLELELGYGEKSNAAEYTQQTVEPQKENDLTGLIGDIINTLKEVFNQDEPDGKEQPISAPQRDGRSR